MVRNPGTSTYAYCIRWGFRRNFRYLNFFPSKIWEASVDPTLAGGTIPMSRCDSTTHATNANAANTADSTGGFGQRRSRRPFLTFFFFCFDGSASLTHCLLGWKRRDLLLGFFFFFFFLRILYNYGTSPFFTTILGENMFFLLFWNYLKPIKVSGMVSEISWSVVQRWMKFWSRLVNHLAVFERIDTTPEN